MRGFLSWVMTFIAGMYAGYAVHQALDYFQWQRPMEKCVRAKMSDCHIGKAHVHFTYPK